MSMTNPGGMNVKNVHVPTFLSVVVVVVVLLAVYHFAHRH